MILAKKQTVGEFRLLNPKPLFICKIKTIWGIIKDEYDMYEIIKDESKIKLINKYCEKLNYDLINKIMNDGCKKNEILEACLKREIAEELGVEIKVENHLITVQHEYETKYVTLYFYNCSTISGELESKEGQAIKWISAEFLYDYTFPPPDLEVIDYLNR